MIYLIGIVIVVAIAAAVWLRPRQQILSRPDTVQPDMTAGAGGNDSIMTGQILAYLVGNFLIDSQQYQSWRSLTPEELKVALGEAGIMTDVEFDCFNQQLAAEMQLQMANKECSYQEKYSNY